MRITPCLPPGADLAPSDTYLKASPDEISWGRLPLPGARPVATIQSGDAVTIDTVSHEGLLEDQGGDPVAFFGRWGIPASAVLDDVRELAGGAAGRTGTDGPHVLLGPIEVRGAQPGDVLCVEPLSYSLRAPYGIISNRHGRGVLAGELPRASEVVSTLARVGDDGRGRIDTPSGRALTFELRPFLGLIGVTPAEEADSPSHRSSTPPGPHGGNLDIQHLHAGSRLFLPVQVEGGGLYVGDPHYAQGNGEVALTAFEAPLRAHLRVTVMRDSPARALARALANPWAQTSTHDIVIGLGASLDEAMRACVRNAITYVRDATGVDEQSALAFLSAAADFEVSQAVNLVVGVHCLIKTRDLLHA